MSTDDLGDIAPRNGGVARVFTLGREGEEEILAGFQAGRFLEALATVVSASPFALGGEWSTSVGMGWLLEWRMCRSELSIDSPSHLR